MTPSLRPLLAVTLCLAIVPPMMTITGTRDRGVGGQGVEWK